LYFRKGSGKCFPESYEDAKTFYIAPINHKDKKEFGHPTIKPLDITEKIIRNSTREGQLVLDPFMGSGTTGVAALNNNRNFIGIELDEGYFNIAKNRIENMNNK
jgi:site-specific DNA-methyltransferase (adenine-specific)